MILRNGVTGKGDENCKLALVLDAFHLTEENTLRIRLLNLYDMEFPDLLLLL